MRNRQLCLQIIQLEEQFNNRNSCSHIKSPTSNYSQKSIRRNPKFVLLKTNDEEMKYLIEAFKKIHI